MAASFEIVVKYGRTSIHDFPLTTSAGAAVLLADADIVRFKIGGVNGSTPLLDLVEGTKTAGGSGISVTNSSDQSTAHVVYGENETLNPGIHDAEIIVVDDSVGSPLANPTLYVFDGIIHILPGLAGNTGLVD